MCPHFLKFGANSAKIPLTRAAKWDKIEVSNTGTGLRIMQQNFFNRALLETLQRFG